MDLRHDFKQQFRAALAMLAQCVERCPDDLWTTPNPRDDDGDRVIYRAYWRIALHAAFYAQLYLGQSLDAFQPWPNRRLDGTGLLDIEVDIEPFELPEAAEPYSREQTLAYIAYIGSIMDATVDGLDLDSPESGFPWYRNMSKLSHLLLNLRHLQGHVGQLSELLMARGIEVDWVGNR